MKSCNTHNPAIAAVAAWWLSNIIIPAKAFHYGYAAERDERKGFPYTAAMKWRKAAELFSQSTRAAEYSWRQWERIMHLPRRLAGPTGISHRAAFPLPSASAQLDSRLPSSWSRGMDASHWSAPLKGCSVHRRLFGATNKVASSTARIVKRSTLPAPAALIPQQTTPEEAAATV